VALALNLKQIDWKTVGKRLYDGYVESGSSINTVNNIKGVFYYHMVKDHIGTFLNLYYFLKDEGATQKKPVYTGDDDSALWVEPNGVLVIRDNSVGIEENFTVFQMDNSPDKIKFRCMSAYRREKKMAHPLYGDMVTVPSLSTYRKNGWKGEYDDARDACYIFKFDSWDEMIQDAYVRENRIVRALWILNQNWYDIQCQIRNDEEFL